MPDINTNPNATSSLPDLDDMLQSLLLVEEGEHEFTGEEEGARELRQLFFPVTRYAIYFNHASNGPLPRPTRPGSDDRQYGRWHDARRAGVALAGR